MKRITELVPVVLVAAAALFVSPNAAGVAGPSISASGIVNATDEAATYFANAGQFSINAGVKPNGSAYGSLNLVGRGDFAAAWGACPYDARCENYPNTATKTFHLSGVVDSVTASAGQVVASGLLTEIDHGKGDGVIFEEHDVQFSVTANEGSSSMVLQFCLLPPFTLDMANGNLKVSASNPQAKLFQQPAQRATQALPCHAPASISK